MPSLLEREDIQNLVFSGYPKLPGAVFELMKLSDIGPARRWIRHLAEKTLTTGTAAPAELAVHLAFTAEGLRALRLDDEVLGGFALPFREGMVSATRSNILGDMGENGPPHWEWGRDDDLPHGLLLVYATTQAEARRRAEELHRLPDPTGWHFHPLADPVPLRDPDSRVARPRLKEHFGFDDGISNPSIRGEGRDVRASNEIAAGEVVLGYPDETGAIPSGPKVSPGAAGGALLPKGAFGRNGSFLVFRQLEQRPVRFWRFLREAAGADGEAVRLASKMVGRWPNGAPLARWSTGEPASGLRDDDDYLYAGDPAGHGCPIGAHVRRTNPRDALPLIADPQDSIRASNRRRLMRRGRTYGAPVAGWPDPIRMAEGDDDDDPRGLHFLCLCADIDRQFEFVQQAWINSRKFGGLANDSDPLLSNPKLPGIGASDFTFQAQPVSRRIAGLPQFVRTRGGAYFFLPGRRSLRYLAGLRTGV